MSSPYDLIFVSNILRRLSELGMTKKELADTADISISYLSDITKGHANPSLEKMVQIAEAVKTPLPVLLEHTDLDPAAVAALAGGKGDAGLPPGYERICAIVTEHQAFQIRRWEQAARKKTGR